MLSASTGDSNIHIQCSHLNFTSTSTYKSNTISLFTSLVNSASLYNFKKFHTTRPSDDAAVYGLFQCRGDLSSTNCKTCVAKAVSHLMTSCPMSKSGQILLLQEGCFVKYDNTSFFGTQDKTELYKRCGSSIGYNSDISNRINGVLAYLVGGTGYFRMGDFGSIRGVAQCVQDLSLSYCEDCLTEACERLRSDCETSTWADMYLGKCYIRYGADQGKSTPIEGSGEGSGGGRKDNIGKQIAYVIAAIAAIAVVGGLSFAFKNSCNNIGNGLEILIVVWNIFDLLLSTFGTGYFGLFFDFIMAEDGKFVIEKFNGSDFSWWKMQMEALLGQKDLDMVLEEKPENMDKEKETQWNAKDKKARGTITLALTRNVAYNIMSETTARGMMLALSNMLSYVKMKFDDETKAVLLLSSLPDSWSGTVTAVTNSVGTDGMTFEKIRDLVLGEDIRRRGATGGSYSEMLHVGRGRENSRNSGSSKGQGRSSSRARPSVRCWNCNEKGHYRSQCPKDKKELNTTAVVGNYSDDEALLLSVESRVDSWVMDSGASFHATHSSDGMRNVKEGDFGKVRLGNGEILDVTGMGDIDLVTTLGSTWTLSNVRIIPRLETKLISVGQLDEQGLDVKFGGGKWKVVKDNLVIARGFKKGSLYLVPVPSGDVATPVKKNAKIGLAVSPKLELGHLLCLPSMQW
ncbi:hypothetical protein SSX86_020792 [Deinandra increscens subsp. villosa]|uniref:Uncharacterized protein n=1 Tax=Deinandra increscens subsp. villosa TaxID=3103831 RepID=A0AAP0GR46_9ASTR